MSEGRVADTVMFSRYAALMAGRGYDVTLLRRRELVPLLSSLPKVERVIDNAAALADDKRPMVQFPLQSVMGSLHLTPDTVPQQCPYLSAPQDRVAAWAGKLAGMDIKVGICWQGETAGVPLAEFAPLAHLRGVRLIALHTQAVLRAPRRCRSARIERPLAEAPVNADTTLESPPSSPISTWSSASTRCRSTSRARSASRRGWRCRRCRNRRWLTRAQRTAPGTRHCVCSGRTIPASGRRCSPASPKPCANGRASARASIRTPANPTSISSPRNAPGAADEEELGPLIEALSVEW